MISGATCIRSLVLVFLALAAHPAMVSAQWTNRYPRVEGYGHQVYLEGYEMPTLTNGPIDPAPSPDGTRLAFASHGWIWVMDLVDGSARRLTSGTEMDARPAWSPEGSRIAFVRDDTRDTMDRGGGRRDRRGGAAREHAGHRARPRLLGRWPALFRVRLGRHHRSVGAHAGNRGEEPGHRCRRHRVEAPAGHEFPGIPRQGGRKRSGAGPGARRSRLACGIHSAHPDRRQHRLHGPAGAQPRRVDGGGELADPGGLGASAGERDQPGRFHPAGRPGRHRGRHAAHARVEPARR